MKSLLLALLLTGTPALAGVQGIKAPIPFDAAIVTPSVAFVQYGPTVVSLPSLPAVADETTVFQISWPCQGCKIEVIVPKKDGEDTGAWKRRIKIAVDAAKELFPPDPS